MSIEQIKTDYPNEWVVLGNPVFEGMDVIDGEVLFHAKEKRDLAAYGPKWRQQYESATHIFTGTFEPKHFLL